MPKQETVPAYPIEYLSATAGKIGKRAAVIMTVRLNPPSFAPTNLGLTMRQAEILHETLGNLLKSKTKEKK